MSLLQRTEVLVQREVEPPFLKAPVPERSGRHEMTDLCFSEDSTWSVLILNDDHTPMEFVVDAIEEFFDMDRESAMRLMLRIHSDGAAECGIYSHEIAKAKAMQVVAFAREHRHPLQCAIERKQSKCWPSEAQRGEISLDRRKAISERIAFSPICVA
jgi:ATP-dependent Clp protease adaptor protein ClpS